MTRISVGADVGDFDVFDNSSTSGVDLTERERALLSTALCLINDRRVWAAMTDAEWDDLESDIAAIEGQLS